MMETPLKRFICSYPYRGRTFDVYIDAEDFEDAEARRFALALGKIEGIWVATIPYEVGPMRTGWLVRLVVWLRNLLR